MSKFIYKYALVLLSLATAGAPPGSGEAPGRIHFGHYGDIRAIYRTGDSLWVGTGGGLLIYDLGRDEITASRIVGKELPSSSIRVITGRGDSIFVGTDGGLSIFSGDSVEVYTPRNRGAYEGVPFEQIRSIDFGLDRVIYLSTLGHGLGVLDGDTSWVITREDSLLDDKVYGMVQEDDTTFYFATSMGLCAYRDSAWVGFQAGAGIPRAEVRKILAAPEAGYYLLVGGRGVYRFNGFRARRITYQGLFPENAVSDMVLDSRGNLWACGSFGGIAVYQNGHWTKINENDPACTRRRWRTAYADGFGGVFFGSADGMLLLMRDNVLTRIRLPDELVTGSVGAITADSSRALYLLDGSYLLRMPPGGSSWSVDYPDQSVVAVAVSPGGQLFLATRWGIYSRGGDGYVELDTETSQKLPLFSALGFDSYQNLWLGTQAGDVYRYDGEVWMRMGDADELGVGSVKSFAADGGGRLWVTGTAGGGNVSSFDGRRWVRYDQGSLGGRPAVDLVVSPNGVAVLATDEAIWGFGDPGTWRPVEFPKVGFNEDLGDSTSNTWDPGSPSIRTLEFDQAGRLYVGTENGVAVIDNKGTRWVRDADGLGGKAVRALYADKENNLWVGFVRDGLTKLALNSL